MRKICAAVLVLFLAMNIQINWSNVWKADSGKKLMGTISHQTADAQTYYPHVYRMKMGACYCPENQTWTYGYSCMQSGSDCWGTIHCFCELL